MHGVECMHGISMLELAPPPTAGAGAPRPSVYCLAAEPLASVCGRRGASVLAASTSTIRRRDDRNDIHHARMHVEQEVAVKRPVADMF